MQSTTFECTRVFKLTYDDYWFPVWAFLVVIDALLLYPSPLKWFDSFLDLDRCYNLITTSILTLTAIVAADNDSFLRSIAIITYWWFLFWAPTTESCMGNPFLALTLVSELQQSDIENREELLPKINTEMIKWCWLFDIRLMVKVHTLVNSK